MREFAAVFERTATGWSAYLPDLPGLGVAGETYEETQTLLQEATEMHLAGLLEDGEPVPVPMARVTWMAVPA